jgi:hypothetical protein
VAEPSLPLLVANILVTGSVPLQNMKVFSDPEILGLKFSAIA